MDARTPAVDFTGGRRTGTARASSAAAASEAGIAERADVLLFGRQPRPFPVLPRRGVGGVGGVVGGRGGRAAAAGRRRGADGVYATAASTAEGNAPR